MPLDEAKRHGKEEEDHGKNIFRTRVGGRERKIRHSDRRKGRKGKERDESVELCPVYIIAYWLIMPVHKGGGVGRNSWVGLHTDM
jgi:hypothetical protein